MPPGACLLVLGPSGSGKSTLALALGGLLPRQRPGTWEGRLSVDGLDVSRAPGPEIAGRVGLLFQDPSSQLVMDRVQDDVAFGLENRGWRAADMHLRVPEALIEVGLADQARAPVATLSGGQQQRVALAGVLAPRPGLLVLDEPTANLDPPAAGALVAELAAIRERRSATVVLIEHRVELVWGLADLLLVLGADGRPMAFGAPGVVIERSGQGMAHAGVWLPRAVEERLGPDGRTPAVRVRPDGSDRPDPGGPPERRHALVEARGLDFAYERDAAVRRSRAVVRDVSLRVRSGERIALVGPNASGKSTLAKLLVGLLKPARGSVELFADAPDGATPRGGAPPDRMPAAVLARRAGYVFQDPERQFLTSRLLDEVMLGLRPEERAGVPTLMESLGLPLADFAARSPYALSGGEQRRLSLACSLVRRPGLLVLDEPTFGQDRLGYESLLSMLHDRIVTGAAVIAATHDERFVADFGRRVVRLAEGRLVEDRVVDDTQQPATATVERKNG